MRVNPVEVFAQSQTFAEALGVWTERSLVQCGDCKEFFDEPSDLEDGICRLCMRAFINTETGH